jgi:hypothetical protein
VSRERLAIVFFASAAILTLVSFFLVMAYAGPEPFFHYQRGDAIFHVGLSTAAIVIWLVWSIGIVMLVAARVFGIAWLSGLMWAAICIFYLQGCSFGYLDDLENYMLSPEQKQGIDLPRHNS